MADSVAYPARASDYGLWLANRCTWQLFCTLTFKDFVRWGTHADLSGATMTGVGGAERALRYWFRYSVRSRSFASGVSAYAVFSMEAHKWRDTPHFHGLVGGIPRWMEYDVARGRAFKDRGSSYVWAEWFQRNGSARMERVRESVSVAAYVAKYVTKASGKMYMFGSWPQVSEYEDVPIGEEDYDRWAMGPGSRNAERMWREMCED